MVGDGGLSIGVRDLACNSSEHKSCVNLIISHGMLLFTCHNKSSVETTTIYIYIYIYI